MDYACQLWALHLLLTVKQDRKPTEYQYTQDTKGETEGTTAAGQGSGNRYKLHREKNCERRNWTLMPTV